MSTPRILVVGSANIDLVTRVPHCPRPGETLLGRDFATVLGGKGANQAVAAARLGGQVSFAGCVGDDAFGGLQRAGLAAEGIDLTYLRTDPTQPTGTAVILVAEEGQNAIVVTPGANFAWTPADAAALDPAIAAADVVLLQLEVPVAVVDAVLDRARAHGVLSILDIGSDQAIAQEILAKADVVSPNETEIEHLTGIAIHTMEDAHAAAAKLCAMGVREVVLKLGARGALYVGDETYHAAPFTVNAVDTTAAGDAFTGALAVVWERLPRQEALRFANAAGALAATVFGAQPAMPTRAALNALLANGSVG